MSARSDAIDAGRTRELQWHKIARAALILGIVPDYSKGSMTKVADMLKAQVDAGRVTKRKEGDYQGAPAFYSAKLQD